MEDSHCLLGHVGVFDCSAFFLFVALTAIVMTKTKVTLNGIQIFGGCGLDAFVHGML